MGWTTQVSGVPLWTMAEGGAPWLADGATAVGMAAVGWWLVVRVVKLVGGRLEQEEQRLKRQEAEVEALRVRVSELGIEVAKCHAERDYNARALEETRARLARIEEHMP